MVALPVLIARPLIAFLTESLPDAVAGAAYNATIIAPGASSFAITSGALASGHTLVSGGGSATITGTATSPESAEFQITAYGPGAPVTADFSYGVGLAAGAITSPTNQSYVADSTPTITWDAVVGADTYDLLITTDDDPDFATPLVGTLATPQSVAAPTVSYTLSDQGKRKGLLAKMRPVNASWGVGAWSPVVWAVVRIYELEQEWAYTDTAPMTTPATGEVGDVTIRDSVNVMHADGSKLVFDTGTTTLVAWEKQVTRAAGRVLAWETTLLASAAVAAGIRNDSNISSNAAVMEMGVRFDFPQVGYNGADIVGWVLTAFPYLHYRIVLRATGAYLFGAEDEVPTSWVLIWASDTGSAASPYFRLVRGADTAANLTNDYARIYSLDTFTDMGYAAVNVATPVSGTIQTVGDADFIAGHIFAYPGSPANGDKIELRFNVQDANNYWTAYLLRNGSVWDAHMDSVVAGAATARITVATNVGTKTEIRIQKIGNRRKFYSRNGTGAWVEHGAVTTTVYLDTVEGIAAAKNAGTSSLLYAYPSQSSAYNILSDNGHFLVAPPAPTPPAALITPPAGSGGTTVWTDLVDDWIGNPSHSTQPLSPQPLEFDAAKNDSLVQGRAVPIACIPLLMAHEQRPELGFYTYVKSIMAIVKPIFVDHATAWQALDGYRDIIWYGLGDTQAVGAYGTDTNNLDESMMMSWWAFYALFAQREGDTAERDWFVAAIEETFNKWISRGKPVGHPLDDNLSHSRLRSCVLYWCMFGLTGSSTWYDAAFYEYSLFAAYLSTEAVGAETALLWNHQYVAPTLDRQKNTYFDYTLEALYVLNYLGFPGVTNTMLDQAAVMLRGIDFANWFISSGDANYRIVYQKIDATGDAADKFVDPAAGVSTYYKSALSTFWYVADRDPLVQQIAEDVQALTEPGLQSRVTLAACMVAAGF